VERILSGPLKCGATQAQKKVYLVYTEDSGCRAFVPHGSYNSRPLCPGGSAGASGDMSRELDDGWPESEKDVFQAALTW